MTPAAALSVAKQFHHAFELCRGNGVLSLDGRVNPDIPNVVNLAFAIELALKASLLSYRPSVRGHQLKELYEALPEPDRDFILSNMPFDAARFEASLEAVSDAFIEWRYVHEKSGTKSISLEFLMHFWHASSKLAEEKCKAQRNALVAATKK